MTNNKKLQVLVLVFFCFIIILVVMLIYAKNVYTNSESPASTTISTNTPSDKSGAGQASDSTGEAVQSGVNSGDQEKDTLDLKLYVFDADDYDKPKEIRTVTVDKKLYQDDIAAAINKVLEPTGIKLNKAAVSDSTITVDLPKEVALKFNIGSAGGIVNTNILAMTILNLPGIEKLEVTVDGTAGVESDHFSFNGTFVKTENGQKYTFINSDRKSVEFN